MSLVDLFGHGRRVVWSPEGGGGSEHGRSQRQLRVGELLRQVIAVVLARGDTFDPDLEGVAITVSEVQASPDLRHATAFVMPLSGQKSDKDHARIVAALNRNRNAFQEAAGRELTIKFTPRIHFKLETSFDNADKMNAVFQRVAAQRQR